VISEVLSNVVLPLLDGIRLHTVLLTPHNFWSEVLKWSGSYGYSHQNQM